MLQTARSSRFVAFAGTLMLLFLSASNHSAAQTETAAAGGADISYQMPQTQNVDQLAEYLTQLLTYQPPSEEAAAKYVQEGPAAMARTAQQILDLEQDTNSENYMLAHKYLLALDVMSIGQATEAERNELMQLVINNLRHPRMDADDLDIAVAFAEGLESIGNGRAAAIAYEAFGQVLTENNDTLIAELGELMLGAARRLSAIGQPIQVQGTTLEGRPFDWNLYRGKVVLIDFWATWCGPCRAEMPQLVQLYNAYHDRGFEVVSISMDDDRAALDEYLKGNPLPWTTLFEPGERENPTARYYGISELPSTMLVDQQGRVVSVMARGDELSKLLKQMLGEP